ncbi:MAG: Fe-S cluster protein [Methanomicrobiaceae archaeon]|nr:Fe-S cluster protein [Methanomicrobiaceae archaeon]
MKDTGGWIPPGKNCGACGAPTCEEFILLLEKGKKERGDCPFFTGKKAAAASPGELTANYDESDILGESYDFILHPLPGEPSARKIVLPFRPDMTEKLEIGKGDLVLGRPMGAGCPVQHVLSVIEADYLTGLLTCHVISPLLARERSDEVKTVSAYHIIGFEGIAQTVNREPVFGRRQRFLPGFCMMYLAHTGVVNMVLENSYGTHTRVEDIRIW